MFTLPHSCTHLTCQQSNAKNSPSQVSIVCELRTSRCSIWIYKRQRNQRSNCQIRRIIKKSREFQKNIYFCFIDYAQSFDCVSHRKLWKILQEMGIPDHLTCLRRRQWHSTPVLLPGKSHGQRSLVGCSSWGRYQSDTTERLHFHFSLSLFTFMHWRRKWQPTPMFLPGEPQGRGSLVGCHLWGRTESDTTDATQQQQQQT